MPCHARIGPKWSGLVPAHLTRPFGQLYLPHAPAACLRATAPARSHSASRHTRRLASLPPRPAYPPQARRSASTSSTSESTQRRQGSRSGTQILGLVTMLHIEIGSGWVNLPTSSLSSSYSHYSHIGPLYCIELHQYTNSINVMYAKLRRCSLLTSPCMSPLTAAKSHFLLTYHSTL